MKRLLLSILLITGLLSCREEVDTSITPDNIFESFWKIMDEKYCFFYEKNVDWNLVHDKYQAKVDTTTTAVSLFRTLGEMIGELQDGHVNLVAAHDVARYWKWFEDFEPNFYEDLEKNYLGTDYLISSGLRYKKLSEKVGYITYRSFSSPISDSGLNYILSYFKDCNGIILDVRDNSGGDLSNVDKLASRFTDKRIISGYIRHKIGPGHRQFSDPYPIYLNPSPYKRYTKKVIILTNRSCFSAANSFVSVMRQLPNVTIRGDQTGGGSGFPISSMLPNGWIVRLSSCPTYNSEMVLTEEGIEPDVKDSITSVDILRGHDTMLDHAIAILNRNL